MADAIFGEDSPRAKSLPATAARHLALVPIVVDVREYRSRETVAVLAYLLDQARKGEIDGLSVCTKFAGGTEEIAFTGWYRRNLAASLASITRVFHRLARLLDEDEHAPEGGW